MFGFHSVNTSEVNASSCKPGERWDPVLQAVVWDAPILSILTAEDTNTLSWSSPYFTDFFTIYWSDDPFTSIDEPGVHAIDTPHGLAPDPTTDISYVHVIPANFSLSVLYYRVLAYNRNGSTLSNQEDNYNFKLAIYEEIYKKTLDDLLLRFTPEIRKQYEDSQLWRSFVQALCSELAQSRFEIKEALKQLNLQKAVDVFLNMWNGIIGISRNNLTDPDTGLLVSETDAEYRQRLVDNVFWDKISNLALKKTMLLKLGYDGTVLDAGTPPDAFKIIPEKVPAKFSAHHGLMYFPGENIGFLFIGPNGAATCVSDDGTTLTYTGYSGPAGTPYNLIGGPLSNGLVWNSFVATPTAAPVLGFAELIAMGGFDTSVSMNNWVSWDLGSEGPLDLTTIYTFRPTTHYAPVGLYYGGVTNPTYAYDTNLSSYANLEAQSAYIDLYGIPAQGVSFATLNLIIRIRHYVTGGYLGVSLNGGGSWSYPGPAGNLGDVFDGTYTIPLSGSQDLSLIVVRVFNYGTITINFDEGIYLNTPAYVYDVRVEGSGVPMPGLSAWSSEYGGSMKLRYGIASREYMVSSTAGQACTLKFVVRAGNVYVSVGSVFGAQVQDVIAEALYGPGSYSIGPVAFTAPSYISFHVRGTEVAYIDNVSCLGTDASAGIITHTPLVNPFGFWVTTPGTVLEFVAANGITKTYGKFVSNIGGVLTFEPTGGLLPHQFDNVREAVQFGQATTLTILLTTPALVTSADSVIRPKLLSNIYSVNLGVTSLPDDILNDIYDAISPLGAIGNVLTKILQDSAVLFNDWDTALGNIPYGPIFMGATDPGNKSTETNWSIGEALYFGNDWTMGNSKKFYGNSGPDDIVTLTRTS